MTQLLADMHVHSRFSVDSEEGVPAICRAAIERGVTHLCLTEHLDLNPNDIGYGFYRYEAISEAIDAARDAFGDRLTLLKGVEFGEPHLYRREFERALRRDYDLVIGANHWLGDAFVGEQALLERYTLDEFYEQYYQMTLEMVRLGGFDVLAHLDLPKRYLRRSVEPDGLLDELLGELVAHGIMLEINTSPLRKGLSECTPDASLLARYARAGGSRLTLGSDAHVGADVAAGFDVAERLAAQAGLGPIGYFQGRQFTSLAAPTPGGRDGHL